MAEKLFLTKRIKVLKVLLFVAVIFVLGMVVYFPNYSRLKKLREEKQDLLKQISSLEKEIEDFKIKSEKLKEDSFIYEEIARDRLGVLREGEIVVDIQE